MCGIITGEKNSAFNPLEVQKAMLRVLHRGPDSQNVKYLKEHKVFLSHTRLSIVGLENGVQPLMNTKESIVAVVNGEFYDFEKIKAQFPDYQFKTNSDSEILIPLYEKYGVNCLEYLHGEFAFVLFDKAQNTWFAARDRMGIRPLNYILNEDGLYFASEAKSLLELGVSAQLDKNSLWFSQNFQYLPLNQTLFKGISMLPPASFMVVKNKQKDIKTYWSLPEEKTTDSISVASEKIAELLKVAVNRRVPKEVAWCSHLSGGIDSSIVSYLAAQREEKTHNFTVSFTDDGFYNELPIAQDVSSTIGSVLHVVPVSFNEALEAMPKAIYHAEGLSINGHLGAKYLLNQAIHDAGFKVALSGEGSDEIFMGYSHLKQDYLSENNLNSMEKTYLSGVQLPSGDTLDLSRYMNEVGFVPTWLKAKSSMANKLSEFWQPNFIQESPVAQLLEESEAALAFKKYGALKSSSMLWSKYCLSGYILKVLDDAQSMAHSVEGRLPFLDTELMNYVWSMPEEYYFKGNIEKTILRDLFTNKLPQSVVGKTKQSFMSPPIQRALKNKQSKTMIYDYLLNNPYFDQQQIFKKEVIEKSLKLWENNDSATVEPILMTLLSIAIFCNKFELK